MRLEMALRMSACLKRRKTFGKNLNLDQQIGPLHSLQCGLEAQFREAGHSS